MAMVRAVQAARSAIVDSFERFGVSMAAALLALLCCYTAAHSPAFDGLRAGAYLLRTRRGACLSLTRSEAPSVEAHYSHLPTFCPRL